jgi:hypothetical protein
MFIGHFAVAFAAKRVAPRASLGATFVAAQLADLLWPIFLLLGVERVRISPTPQSPFLTLDFTSYPWSHSLVTELALGVALGALAFAVTRDRRAAVALALLVPSHWILDLVVHVPDLPLYPGGDARLGLGLWRNPTATLILELSMMAAGVWIYSRSTRARSGRGWLSLWLLVVFLLGIYALSLVSPPPPSVTALAVTGLIGWPLALWPWWVDRRREPR